ncbi:hypothetical protein [Hymenobacter sp. GOD-10R]|uniref:tetratricopeptide repeat protein n=1 Tax=Hymenobacter sp. GOD-10R TaxID=3093922 RepID=UPI002D79B2A3|nr:hypothetical protein [Hymenobacter sp. GOD-10R]WRQ31115.1 hypothetical protein SD425_12685 [Hymenobacter sp. GOD-10R]
MKNSCLLFVLALLFGVKAVAQAQGTLQSNPAIAPADTARMGYLHRHGVQRTAGGVTAWFPKDSLSSVRMQGLTDTLALGIQAVKDYIKAPMPWQKLQQRQQVTFYFVPELFVSHASGEAVTFIPYWRIRRGMAPWLHEANHELLAPVRKQKPKSLLSEDESPLWLNEGAAEFIALQVAAANQLPKFDLFRAGTIEQVDKACLRLLRSDKAAYILSYIGSPGEIPELAPSGNQRALYAPTFYTCSCSFNKFLVARYGIATLLNVIGAYPAEQQKLATLTQVSPQVLRTRWLTGINAAAGNGDRTFLPQDSVTALLKTVNLTASKLSAATWFRQTINRQGIATAARKFADLKKKGDPRYKFSETDLNEIGYDLLDANRVKEAILVFGLNVEFYPSSANAYDSWAEAYLIDNQPALARRYYAKSLELNPHNANAKAVLQRLTK